MSDPVYFERDGSIASVVLNNPEKMNALSFAMWMRLGEIVRELEALRATVEIERDADGRWTDAFRMVRAQVLLAAHACEVLPIDTLFADFRDLAGLERAARESYADGFAGMLAIHPDQVPVINAAFMPREEDIAEARRIVAAFAAAPGAGALQMDGRMFDQPHLEQARRLLASLA